MLDSRSLLSRPGPKAQLLEPSLLPELDQIIKPCLTPLIGGAGQASASKEGILSLDGLNVVIEGRRLAKRMIN